MTSLLHGCIFVKFCSIVYYFHLQDVIQCDFLTVELGEAAPSWTPAQLSPSRNPEQPSPSLTLEEASPSWTSDESSPLWASEQPSPSRTSDEPSPLRISAGRLAAILRSSFDVVVFSLLLEYLPSPFQRWTCVSRAWEVLRLYGLLVIVTPDSHQVHRAAVRMRSWRTAIEAAGFHRVRYEKLDHLHCMAYRKVPRDHRAVPDMAHMIYIPQDNNTELSDDDTSVCDHTSSQDLCARDPHF